MGDRPITDYLKGMAYEAMRSGTKEKFKQNPLLMEALLATGSRELVYVGTRHQIHQLLLIVEQCFHHDTYWGVAFPLKDPGMAENRSNFGDNRLGKILMEIREEYRKSKKPETGLETRPSPVELLEVTPDKAVLPEQPNTIEKDNSETIDDLGIDYDNLYETGYSSQVDHTESGDSFHHLEDDIDYGSD